MDLGLAGRVALVTAASRGLGRACALALAAEGMRVAVAARDVEALGRLAAEIDDGPGEALLLPLDLADADAPARAVEAVVERWGALHALIANAPGPPSGRVLDLDDDQWERALELNVLSTVRLTRAAARVMVGQRDGRIIYISTIGVRTAQPDMVLSNATRLAVLGLAKTLSLEVAEHNVLVNVVAPGPIEGDRMDDLFAQTAERLGMSLDAARAVWIDEVPLRRMGSPDDVAAMVTLLSSPRCGFTTGAVIPVDGGKARGY